VHASSGALDRAAALRASGRLKFPAAERPGSEAEEEVLRAEPSRLQRPPRGAAPGAGSDDAHQGRELRCPSLAHAWQLTSDRAIMPFRVPGDRTPADGEEPGSLVLSLSPEPAAHRSGICVWWWARGRPAGGH
jgi:hypothetical protein